ncbi:Nn.00g026380.m01.CDS01 [Neocucurbitaria sp. VM-36]
MLSPNDIAPKSKAASIWSFDSGYGSNTLEDDETVQADYHGASRAHQACYQSTKQSIGLGLGLGGFWNVNVQDQLRVTRPESPIRPVTTKLNVFTTKEGSNTDFILPQSSDSQNPCVTCQLWNITNPGENVKCEDCRDKTFVVPQALHVHDGYPREKLAVPQLKIPREQRTQRRSFTDFATRCSACEVVSLIDPAKSSGCISCSPDPGLLSPISPAQPSKVKRSCARRPANLPPHALRCLQAWLRNNQNNPYPDAESKSALAQECHITEKQVNTWFTNARARRLKNSADRSYPPSEDEGHYESGVSSTETTPIGNSSLPFGYGTPFDRRCSDTSNVAAISLDQATLKTARRGKKKDYSLMSTPTTVDNPASSIPPTPVTTPTISGAKGQKTWQCTFCYQHIAPKSWRRHEETQHRPKRKWTCLLTGPRLTISSRSNTSTVCAFCRTKDPSEEHFLRSHRIIECMKKSEDERTFLRPDHLRQHVKNFHKATLWDIVRDSWRRNGPGKDEVENWACGFCCQELKTWDIRETHIAGHFKDGLTMGDWGKYNRPKPTVETTKKRRNSNDDYSSMFTKLARTFTGQPTDQPGQMFPSTDQSANACDSLPTSSMGQSLPATPLLPDMVFDAFMAEVCGNCFDTSNPTAAGLDEVDQAPNNRYDSVFPDGENMDFDFDTLADVFLNGSSMEFQGPWDQRQT